MAEAPPAAPPPRRFSPLLRRTDQACVAVLVLIGLGATAAWWFYHGGHAGRLLEIERAAPLAAEFRVDVNKAAWPEFAQIPGLGQVLSQRIVAYREEHGPFAAIADLERIRGIGPKTLEALRPYLALSATAAAAQ